LEFHPANDHASTATMSPVVDLMLDLTMMLPKSYV
jgi:hypothetical protein